MSDDVFKLGNFSGIDGDGKLEDLDEISPSSASSAMADEASSPVDGEGDNDGVIKHPTIKSDPQAKFRDRDGNPLLELPLSELVPNEFQPRRLFDAQKLQELAESIKEIGIIQPIVAVRREDGKYEIIVGERRFRAAKLAGLQKVPVFVNAEISAEAKLELALIENIQRADLNPIEEAKAYQRLQQEFGLSAAQIGKKVSKDVSTVSNLVRLLNLPAEIQRALMEEKITEGQARPLLSLRDPEEILQMFAIVMREQMKVRDVETKVREIRNRKIKVKDMFTPDPFIESLESLLRSKLGTRVQVNKNAKGGKITIEFYSDEELNNILSKMS